ncbi:MAG: GntR family transcriptional regulator [Anaerolineae bacterium]|nr:GntR family transcriptional regulator [Anaerolineae bacterium]
MNVDFKPVRANLGQQVFEYLLEHIYKMDIAPGTRLGVGEIADQLGVSRSPVRDAIHLLMAEGLVEYGTSSGYQVIPVDRKYVEDVFVVRRALEPTGLRLAARHLDRECVAQLCDRWQQLRTHPHSTDPDTLETHINADSYLHQSIGVMSGNAVLSEMVTKVVSRAAWIRRWVYSNRIPESHLAMMAEEHLQILDALQAGQADRGADLLEQHLASGQAIALNYL